MAGLLPPSLPQENQRTISCLYGRIEEGELEAHQIDGDAASCYGCPQDPVGCD